MSVGSTTFARDQRPKMDLLFVIDDSASMAAEQILLAHNFGAFANVLESPDLNADWRAAIIRTSGSACGDQAGEALITSCRERLEDFIVPPGREAGEQDLRSICLDNCQHDSITTLPTTVDLDMVPKSRPWLESSWHAGRQRNIDITAVEALTCIGLAGVSGCDYESPFEAIRAFIHSTYIASDPNYGFLRLDAPLFIVIISDEDDCSVVDSSILDPDGEQVFWPASPEGERAPSSVCFKAGSACTDEGDRWDCVAVDRRADGSQTPNPDEAVLVSLSAIDEDLRRLDEEKRDAGMEWKGVLISTVGGFASSGNAYWPKEGPAEFLAEFGVGPACDVPFDLQAVSPARVQALTQLWRENSTYSSCSADYAAALSPLAPSLLEQLRPYCFTHCASTDEESGAPQCRVTAYTADGEVALPECVRDENGYVLNADLNEYQVPEGSEACVAYLVDQDGDATESALDDISPDCVSDGFNLEFKVAHKRGSALLPLDRYVASCVLDLSEEACPGL